MNPRTQALITIGLVITILTVFFLFIFIRQQKTILSDTIHNEHLSLQNQMKLLNEQAVQRYTSRIRSLVISKPQVMKAFAKKDRADLLKQAGPFLELFKKENSYFKELFFANPDNIIFLRVGRPELHGDDVTHLSPLVQEGNRVKKIITGFEIVKQGLHCRFVHPVFVDKTYVGLVGFSIDASLILDKLHQTRPDHFQKDGQGGAGIALIFPKAELNKAVLLDKAYRIIGNYAVFFSDNPCFQELPDHIDFEQRIQRVRVHGLSHALIHGAEFKDFKGNVIAEGLSLFDIESFVAGTKRTIVQAVIVAVSLLFFAVALLYFNFSLLFKKITTLNNLLEQTNKELEHRVEERTGELQQEISDRKQTEKALRESENYLRSIYHAAENVAFVVTDLAGEDTKILDITPGAEKIFQCKRKDVIGKKVAMFHLPEVAEEFPKMQAGLSEKNTGYPGETVLVRKSGERFPALFTLYPKFDDQGDIDGTIGVSIDITKRKEEEERYKKTIESSIDGFWIVDTKGDFLEVNKAYCDMIGYRRNELLNMSIMDVEVVEQPEDTKKRIEKIIKTGSDRFESRHRHKKGNIIELEVSITYSQDSNGMFFVFLRDITERKQFEVQLRQAQKMESIGTLAGGIAHDFNNILFPIVGHTEMLIEDLSEDSPLRSSLDEIYTGALRARDLVKQILTFSRQENSELKLMKMQPIIKEALKLIRSAVSTTIEIRQDIQAECGVIKADPTQIHQIIMNLATNAYHAMEETGGKLKVNLKEIELGQYDVIKLDMIPGTYACLTIADTGKGMNKELTRKIFDPFFTTKEEGKGTGMGLSVVHGIVKSMRGA
ncbi:MAG: PAS domain S-box protein, partial [Desulfobacula sp.]|nr:PAS domain S-box protein [Desulfobacula sp.]